MINLFLVGIIILQGVYFKRLIDQLRQELKNIPKIEKQSNRDMFSILYGEK